MACSFCQEIAWPFKSSEIVNTSSTLRSGISRRQLTKMARADRAISAFPVKISQSEGIAAPAIPTEGR